MYMSHLPVTVDGPHAHKPRTQIAGQCMQEFEAVNWFVTCKPLATANHRWNPPPPMTIATKNPHSCAGPQICRQSALQHEFVSRVTRNFGQQSCTRSPDGFLSLCMKTWAKGNHSSTIHSPKFCPSWISSVKVL